ncbi:MAG: type IV secretion system protein [Wolbachia endosymbiont of Menacanthus eurysternus]|nr:MAG: type IV secretion system protein [Wolbachia endosymbiont of Menacanthus eurysternus]
MFKTKLTFLLTAIILLNIDFLSLYPVFASDIIKNDTEKIKFTSRFNSAGSFNLASNPNCETFKTTAALAGITIAISAIFTGIILIVSSTGLFSALVIVGMITAIIGVWKTIGGLVVCQHSFVKHPVARDRYGKYKDFKLKNEYVDYSTLTNKNYQTEDEYFSTLQKKSGKDGKQTEKEILDLTDWKIIDLNRENYFWPKNSVQYSEYIEVCYRNPLTFNNLFKINNFDLREKPGYIDFDVREKNTGYVDGLWSPKVDGELKCEILKAGQNKTINGSTFKAVRKTGRLCVELEDIDIFGIKTTPWPQGVDIGCTELPPDPISPMCKESKMKFRTTNGVIITDNDPFNDLLKGSENKDYKSLIKEREKEGEIFIGYDNTNCFERYISESCYNQTGSKSLAPIPITSMIVQCIKESLDNLVAGIDSSGNLLINIDGSKKGSFLSSIQKKMKNTITTILILALMLFSIKAMSGGIRSIQEMYILIIKFALVIYFTTGNTMSHYYEELTKLSNGLSEIVLKASSESKNICNYETGKDYEYLHNGKRVSYNYLAPWDRLDCRILFYLGAPLDGISNKIGNIGSMGVLTILLGAAPTLLVAGSIIGIIFAGGQILVALTCIFMAVMMMMVILWICYIFILSLIALSVIIILSPLFIPMILFQHTKGYFDGWLKELITYSLYPVMLFAFLSFMFVACDKIYFKKLTFEKEKIKILGNEKQWFKLKNDKCDNNENTLACMMQNYNFKKSTILGILDFTYIEFNNSLIGELLKLTLILFLFYHFLSILPGMAAELSGNYRASLSHDNTTAKMISKFFSTGKSITEAIGKAKLEYATRTTSKNDIT